MRDPFIRRFFLGFILLLPPLIHADASRGSRELYSAEGWSVVIAAEAVVLVGFIIAAKTRRLRVTEDLEVSVARRVEPVPVRSAF